MLTAAAPRASRPPSHRSSNDNSIDFPRLLHQPAHRRRQLRGVEARPEEPQPPRAARRHGRDVRPRSHGGVDRRLPALLGTGAAGGRHAVLRVPARSLRPHGERSAFPGAAAVGAMAEGEVLGTVRRLRQSAGRAQAIRHGQEARADPARQLPDELHRRRRARDVRRVELRPRTDAAGQRRSDPVGLPVHGAGRVPRHPARPRAASVQRLRARSRGGHREVPRVELRSAGDHPARASRAAAGHMERHRARSPARPDRRSPARLAARDAEVPALVVRPDERQSAQGAGAPGDASGGAGADVDAHGVPAANPGGCGEGVEAGHDRLHAVEDQARRLLHAREPLVRPRRRVAARQGRRRSTSSAPRARTGARARRCTTSTRAATRCT